MRRAKESKLNISGLSVLLLFGIFAVLLLSLLLTCTDAFQKISDRGDETFDSRTAHQYVITKIHQADEADSVDIEKFSIVNSLAMYDTIDGEDYVTRIYWYDGYIRELFSEADADLDPAAGEAIMEANDIDFGWEEGSNKQGLIVKLKDVNDKEETLYIALRSGEEALG